VRYSQAIAKSCYFLVLRYNLNRNMEEKFIQPSEIFKKEVKKIKESLPVVEKKEIEEREREEEKKEKELKESISRILEKEFYPEKEERKEISLKKEIPQEDKEKLSFYLSLAFRQGIKKTAQEVFQTKNPWLIDAFHDNLIEVIKKGIRQTD